MKQCKLENCKNIAKKGTICATHWARWRNHRSWELPPNQFTAKYGKPSITKLGYVRINVGGKRVLEHRSVMEIHLGRKLRPSERIHHINHVKTDNRIENLQLFKNNAEHIKQGHQTRILERKDRYSNDDIVEIFTRIDKPSEPQKPCFCGKPFMARNLCDKHYQWLWKHKFI